MTALPAEDASLGRRLRDLRESRDMTQRDLGFALSNDRSLSPASISAWESGKSTPSNRWLREYARVFGSDAAPPEGLEEELLALRTSARPPARTVEESDPVADDRLGSFWRFSDGMPIRIAGTPMFEDVLAKLDYADRWHPNFMAALRQADMDAVTELFGHVRAANPTSDVRFLTHDRLERDDLTGHVVLLGGADSMLMKGPSSPLAWYVRRLDLPIGARLPEGGDPEYDSEFVVSTDERGAPSRLGSGEDVYGPTFLRDPETDERVLEHGYPQLEYDLGVLVRQANPMNLAATVTICSGIFSRGTYGVVRAMTDVNLRTRNEQYLEGTFRGADFWLLMRVPILLSPRGADTVTPDLSREFHIVRTSG